MPRSDPPGENEARHGIDDQPGHDGDDEDHQRVDEVATIGKFAGEIGDLAVVRQGRIADPEGAEAAHVRKDAETVILEAGDQQHEERRNHHQSDDEDADGLDDTQARLAVAAGDRQRGWLAEHEIRHRSASGVCAGEARSEER